MVHRTKNNIMSAVDADEVKLSEVQKHGFGLVALYAQVIVGMTIAAVLPFFLLPALVGDLDQAFLLASIFGGLVFIFALIVIFAGTFIYKQNRLIITDRNITQVLQSGLFTRKTSQLNLYSVEDVTATEDGFLATMFGFGVLTIETAGEQANFRFTYCPRPGYYAKIILDGREKLLGQMKKNAVHEKRKTVQPFGREVLNHSAKDSPSEHLINSR